MRRYTHCNTENCDGLKNVVYGKVKRLIIIEVISSFSNCIHLCVPQPHVVCGEQLVHSPYMQCLASLAVGLQLDALLCHPPVPTHLAHCLPEPGTSPTVGSWASSEWAWLHCFSTTVKTAEALARGHTFPESFIVPDLEPVAKDKLALLMVRRNTDQTATCIKLFKNAF